MKARNNPFGAERVTGLPFVFANPPEAAWDHLEALNWCGAIVGPCGSGKTTLLEAVEDRLKARGMKVTFCRLSAQNSKLPRQVWHSPPGTKDALLVDGVEQLSLWNWHRLRHHARRAGAFVVTSHRPTSFPLWLETSTSPLLLQQLVSKLGERLGDSDAQALWNQFDGNLRLSLWQLYDDYARLEPESKNST